MTVTLRMLDRPDDHRPPMAVMPTKTMALVIMPPCMEKISGMRVCRMEPPATYCREVMQSMMRARPMTLMIRAFIVTPFKEFGNGRTVQGPVFAGSDETHDDGPNGPGGIVPAGCQADFYGTFSDADGRSSADGHAGNADGDQTRRKFTAGEEIFRRILAGPMFDIHGDGK